MAPDVKGQYLDEIVAGIQYDVGLDLVLGASYVRRTMQSVIEDISLDGGETYLITNPGREADPAALARMDAEIARASQDDKARLQRIRYANNAALIPRPRREYKAAARLI